MTCKLNSFARSFCWLLLLPVLGNAQTGASVPAAEDSSKVSAVVDVDKKREDVKIFLDKIEILGRIEKPQTVFIVQGKDPAIDDIQIDRSFFREMFRPVNKEAIARLSRKQKRK